MHFGTDQNNAQPGTANNDISYDFNHYEGVYSNFISNNRITNDNRYSNHLQQESNLSEMLGEIPQSGL